MWYDRIIDTGISPDFLLKTCVRIRMFFSGFIKNHKAENIHIRLKEFAEELKKQPVAIRTSEAKKQHYEVPADFFYYALGKHMKYSCCLWEDFNRSKGEADLDRAELDMLDLTAERADIKDGMDILELGCGWGSFSIYLATRFPGCKITCVSHSASQKEWIDSRTDALDIDNISVVTADMNDFNANSSYDRIVSIEMFEHMRNYGEIFRRINSWLKPEGRAFIHIFTTQGLPYFFDADNDNDWMARNFFAGGMMPSVDLIQCFDDHLKVEKTWKLSGRHYQKTLLSWLVKMDSHKSEIMRIFKETYGDDANIWWNRWRMFFLSCAVVFGYRNGEIWGVTHYLLKKNI